MPEEEQHFITVIIAVIIILLFLGILFLVMILYYSNRRKWAQKEKELALQQSQAELLKTEFEVQEQTRKNLSADLHDNIGQVLSLTNVTLASINPDDKEKTRRKISDAQELVSRSIRELRQLSKIIQGEQLIQEGLLKTIEQEITWLERNGHYSVQFIHTLPGFVVDTADKDLFVYRLLQESLNNIIKHSGADKITIGLTYEHPFLQLLVADNGAGFNMEKRQSPPAGLGLPSMQKRVNLLKGSMEVVSGENTGVSITFTIPYP